MDNERWKAFKFEDIRRGSIVKHRSSTITYNVEANYLNRATAVRTVDITNPEEWLVYQEGNPSSKNKS